MAGKIKWKDAKGSSYTYIGEIKDGMPHGKGFAKSDSDGIKILGRFNEGVMNGRATVLYPNGKVRTGYWSEGHFTGMGVSVDANNDLFYGHFIDGELRGQFTGVYNSNAIKFVDQAVYGGYMGKVIEVEEQGTIINNNMYHGIWKEGEGWAYNVVDKKMYQAKWENGNPKVLTNGNYKCFMSNPGFGSNVTPDYIYIWSELTSAGQLQDTCFLLDRNKHNRYFGYFEHNEFKSGVEIIGDTTRIIGNFDNSGMQGICVVNRKSIGLMYGNYKDDKLDGDGVLVDLRRKLIMDGIFSNNNLGSDMMILNLDESLTLGSYVDGQLQGEALIINADGSYKRQVFEKGKVVKTLAGN